MAKQLTKEALAADLKARGGPKRPSQAERTAATRKVMAHKGVPIKYDDEAMVKRGATPMSSPQAPAVNSPTMRSGGSIGRPPIQQRPPMAGLEPPIGPQMGPSSGPPRYDPLSSAFQSSPSPRPSMPSAPTQKTMANLFGLLAQLMGQDGEWNDSQWGDQRATNDPRTWMPDLWTLSGR